MLSGECRLPTTCVEWRSHGWRSLETSGSLVLEGANEKPLHSGVGMGWMVVVLQACLLARDWRRLKLSCDWVSRKHYCIIPEELHLHGLTLRNLILTKIPTPPNIYH